MADIYNQYKLRKRHGESDYVEMMPGLLPKGVIWGIHALSYATEWVDTITSAVVKTDTTSSSEVIQDVTGSSGWAGGKLGLLLSCFASELARIESSAWDVLNGTDPGVTTNGYLDDWERNLGLPGDCTSVSQTLEERQISAHVAMWGAYVTTTLQAYIDYAASLGYTITIDESPAEYQPRIMGVARMGVERMGGYGGYSVMEITITAGTGTQAFLECKMNAFKPAHAILLYVDARP